MIHVPWTPNFFLTFLRIASCCKPDDELGHLVNVIDSMKLLLTNYVTGGCSNADGNMFRKERRKHLTHFLEFHTFATDCSPWDRHLGRYQYYSHTHTRHWNRMKRLLVHAERHRVQMKMMCVLVEESGTHTLAERTYTREIHNFNILIGCLSIDSQCNVYLISIYCL